MTYTQSRHCVFTAYPMSHDVDASNLLTQQVHLCVFSTTENADSILESIPNIHINDVHISDVAQTLLATLPKLFLHLKQPTDTKPTTA